MLQQKDTQTIIAISTASVNAAIGIIRISGNQCLAILENMCRLPNGKIPLFKNFVRKQIYCLIYDENQNVIDDGLVTLFKGPASYTGEDLAEISLHGNLILLQNVMLSVLQNNQCRPAQPGEFTRRAYLSGKIDLTQAEAVHRIITARSEIELQAGRKNLSGELSRISSNLRSSIIHLKAETQAEVDFSTEDLSFESKEERKLLIYKIQARIKNLLERAAQTSRLRSGFQISIVGVPNAGKSSLLNLLLGWDRAIVSELPGTTRDYLSEEIQFEGILIQFVDTAGLRLTDDDIERQGIQKTMEQAGQSQLILHIIDGTKKPYLLSQTPGDIPVLYLINKNDSINFQDHKKNLPLGAHSIEISCKNNTGLSEMKEYLKKFIFESSFHSEPLLLENRHKYHLNIISGALNRVLQLWDEQAPDEIIAVEIDLALEQIGQITGVIDTEEILGRIFSVFCVGK